MAKVDMESGAMVVSDNARFNSRQVLMCNRYSDNANNQ